MLHQGCLVACTIQLLRAMRDAERSLQDFSEKGCWISAAHHCLPIFSDQIRPHSTTQDAPTCHQCHDSTPERVHFTISTHHLTSSYIHKNKDLAQDQPDGRKSSVDAHGVSSCLGCSRILRHLISFFSHHQRTSKVEKNHGTRNFSHTSEQGQPSQKKHPLPVDGSPNRSRLKKMAIHWILSHEPTTYHLLQSSLIHLRSEKMCFPDYNI